MGHPFFRRQTDDAVERRHNLLHRIGSKGIRFDVLHRHDPLIAFFEFVTVSNEGKHIVHKPPRRKNAYAPIAVFPERNERKRIRDIELVLV